MTRLWPHQRSTIDAAVAGYRSGLTDQLAVVATGGGKTTTALQLIRENLAPGQRALFLAHRKELIDQPADRWRALFPDRAHEVGAVMGDRDACGARVVVGSVQTLRVPGRMFRYLQHGPPAIVVVDEAHHALADSYLRIIETLRAANPALWHFGMTATPARGDEDGLVRVYQAVCAKFGIVELTELGHLCPFDAYSVQTPVSVSAVKISRGDFAPGDLAKVVDVDNTFELIVATHMERAHGRKALAFTAGVAGAHALARKFMEAGVPAAAVDGTTDPKLRKAILAAFKSGDLMVLCNCAVLTEGFDEPSVEVLHQARPTRKDLPYIQMLGRVIRAHPGKERALVFDYVPVEGRDLVLGGDVLGKPRVQRKAEDRAVRSGVIHPAFSFTSDAKGIDGDPDRLVVTRLDLLSRSPHAWFHHDGLDTLDLGQKDGAHRALALTRPGPDGLHRLLLLVRTRRESRVLVLERSADFARVRDRADAFADAHGVGAATEKDRAWQKRPASPAQVEMLHRLYPERAAGGAPFADVTRGMASRLITHARARAALDAALAKAAGVPGSAAS